MLWMDVSIAVCVLAAILGGFVGIMKLRREAKPEIAGSENAEKVKAIHLRKCHTCHKDTDYGVDVYVDGNWYHRQCFMKEIEEKKSV